MSSKTYAVALGTALLARSVDSRVDPLSIKAQYSEFSYSMRTLGHSVLVPGAQRLGFSIRARGREPLNNQPFFRYDHMSLIDRVRNPGQHEAFVGQLGNLARANSEEARLALAAYLRVAYNYRQGMPAFEAPDHTLDLNAIFSSIGDYLKPGVPERPKRLQALAAAALDVTHGDVGTRKINDPSRDFPGDIQAYDDGKPFLAVEVRGKSVPAGEVLAFAHACARADIWTAAIVVDWRGHVPLDVPELCSQAFNETGVILSVFESFDALMNLIFAWPVNRRAVGIERFINSSFLRLEEIETSRASMAEWVELLRSNMDG